MDVEEIFVEAEDHMKKSIEMTRTELMSIRTGKATPSLLDTIRIDYYGSPVPLKQVANIAIPDPKLITIQPYEKPLVGEIVKTIQSSNLGLNPQSDGNFIRIPLPPLTEERRKELVKTVKQLVEDSRIAVRNVRRDANEKLKKMEKAHELSEDEHHRRAKEIQDLTDSSIAELDELVVAKEKEIMEF
ncbi:MAG: ribosome recycling factor [Candidatus Krumholzibacteriota bacterium]|nr:ribosome recycling factor [Candidatus Krumholzibacteriota bacterium]